MENICCQDTGPVDWSDGPAWQSGCILHAPLILQRVSLLETTSTTDSVVSKRCSYAMVMDCLSALERQLEEARRDIQTLQELKEQADKEPVKFLSLLQDSKECERRFPKMQRIKLMPRINLTQYRRRLTRTRSSRYQQNLGSNFWWHLMDRLSDQQIGRAAAAEE